MDDFEDFFLDNDALGEENALSRVDLAVKKLVNDAEEIIKEMKQNLRFNENADFDSNLEIIFRDLYSIQQLRGIEDSGLSDEEVDEIIDEVETSTTKLTLSNIKSVLKIDDKASSEGDENSSNDPGSTNEDW